MINKYFDKHVFEIIKNRKSIRSYSKGELTEETKEKLRKYMQNLSGPFPNNIRLELIDNSYILEKADGKIGTYGIIKGAQHFIVAVIEKEENSLEQLGYILEELILYATSLGLGTCWMGGTFKRSDFAKLVGLKINEILPIVVPIGYPKEQSSIVDHFMRYAAKSDQRKPWNDLFFNNDFGIALEMDNSDKYYEALEAVRLAPSASNKQPWRILRSDNRYHFYLSSNKGYAEGLGFDIQRIDIGISMCHFEMVLKEKGINGEWKYLSEKNNDMTDLTYIISWVQS